MQRWLVIGMLMLSLATAACATTHPERTRDGGVATAQAVARGEQPGALGAAATLWKGLWNVLEAVGVTVQASFHAGIGPGPCPGWNTQGRTFSQQILMPDPSCEFPARGVFAVPRP